MNGQCRFAQDRILLTVRYIFSLPSQAYFADNKKHWSFRHKPISFAYCHNLFKLLCYVQFDGVVVSQV